MMQNLLHGSSLESKRSNYMLHKPPLLALPRGDKSFMPGPWRLSTNKIAWSLVFGLCLFFSSALEAQSGKAFRDFDGSGVQTGAEPGVQGIAVRLYANAAPPAKDQLIGVTVTGANGSYNFGTFVTSGRAANPGEKLRIEFQIPSSFQCSVAETVDFPGISGNVYGSSVQFIVGQQSGVNFAMNYPGQWVETANPDVYLPCYSFGDPNLGGNAGTAPSFIGFKFLDSGIPVGHSAANDINGNPVTPSAPNPTALATIGEVGSLYGVAFSRQAQKVFTSAVLRRHSALGPMGSGGIYLIDPYSPGADKTTDFINLDAIGIPTQNSGGSYPPNPGNNTSPVSDYIGTAAERGLGINRNTPSTDYAAGDQVGKLSIGDIDISDDGRYLYVVNLYDRRIYEIDLIDAGNPEAPTLANVASRVRSWPTPNPATTASQGEHRPWALKYYRGKLYVGLVLSGQNAAGNVVSPVTGSGNNQVGTDIRGFVFEFDPILETFTERLNFDFDYGRERSWIPWGYSAGNPSRYFSGQEREVAEPIVADIEFDDQGSMLIGILDRKGHQYAINNNNYNGTLVDYEYSSAGELLRANVSQNANGCTYTIVTRPGTTDYYADNVHHPESVQGPLAVLPGGGDALAVFLDPIAIRSGGTIRLDNETGALVPGSAYEVFDDRFTLAPGNTNEATPSKANGLGDVELSGSVAPLEIGNLVWADKDADGIQDGDERGIAGVTVQLFLAGNQIGQTTTNGTGNYYFNDSNVNPAGGGGLDANTTYTIRIPASMYFNGGVDNSPLQRTLLTLTNAAGGVGLADLSDNDAGLVGGLAEITATTQDFGQNDHSFDFGFIPVDYGDLPSPMYPTNVANNGPSHLLGTPVYMGTTVDYDLNGNPDPNAGGTGNGDDGEVGDNDPGDDEDGVVKPAMIEAGRPAAFTVNVVTNTTAYVYGFIDWNKDGNFNGTEEIKSATVNTSGPVVLTFNVPLNAVLNMDLGARFRVGTVESEVNLPIGAASNGEVEDCMVSVMGFDYGDLNDSAPGTATGTPANHETLFADNGARHKIVTDANNNVLLKIGAIVDVEADGQSSLTAGQLSGGDDAGSDDEDGLNYATLPLFIVGQTVTLSNIPVMNMTNANAKLTIYIDFNKDGDFNDAGEMFTSANIPNNATSTNVTIAVPTTAVVGDNLGMRIRLSDANEPMSPSGTSQSGEVEDYVIQVVGYDYGDHPNTYGTTGVDGPRHIISDLLKLGASVDAELDGIPSPMSGVMPGTGGDDNDAGLVTFGTSGPPGDDENGAILATPMIPGTQACFVVNAMNMTGSAAVLQAWVDFNGNGAFEAGEHLTTGSFATSGAIVPTGAGLANAQLCFTVPLTATFTGGNAFVRFRLSPAGGLSADTQTAPYPFGEIEDHKFPLAKIGSYVWEDVNGNGQQNEPTAEGINGVGVQLIYFGLDGVAGGSGANADVTYNTTTATMGGNPGQYMFVGLTPGSYQVSVPNNPAGGFVPTFTGQGTPISDSNAPVNFTIAPNFAGMPTGENGSGDTPGGTNGFPDTQDNLTFDFGYYIPAVLGNYIWLDYDKDGQQDLNEPSVEGAKLTLAGTNNIGQTVNVPMQITTANGFYQFLVAPGTYSVLVDISMVTAPPVLAQWGQYIVFAPVNQGVDVTDNDSAPQGGPLSQQGQTPTVSLLSGDVNTTLDAGIAIPCLPPTPLPVTTCTEYTAVLRWSVNNDQPPGVIDPVNHCWVLTVAGQGLGDCDNAAQALFQTTVCYINGQVSFSAPVTAMTVVGNIVSVTVNGLPPGTDLEFYVSETCDGIDLTNNVSVCSNVMPFVTKDNPYTVTSTTVKPTCPHVSPGYVPNGSFTVNIVDGSSCSGTYMVTAVPVAGSGPGGSTPPATANTTYIGFPQGAFFFGNAGAGCYTVTVNETGPCLPVNDPVVVQVCVPNGMDMVAPIFYVTDVLGNVLADNDPATLPGTSINFGNIAVPEGECGRQDEYYVYGFDNCDGFMNALNAVSATATTTPATVIPGTQVSVTPDGFGFYLVDVHWSTGTSTVSIFGQDASGNVANAPAGLQLTATISDNIDPVVAILSNSQFIIPVCATSVTGIMTFQIDDHCDQNAINFNNLIVNFGGATGVLNFTGGNYREYLVTFPAAGNYLVSASYTDAFGNTGFIDQVITVQQAAANQPPVIQANAETVTMTACQSCEEIVYSFTISDDCAPINIAQVQFNGGGSGLPNLNGAGFFFTDPVSCATLPCNTVYFEVQGCVTPGTYFPVITYQGITANPTITVLQDANQPADIVMPAINVTIPQCQPSVNVIIPITITDDCDNPINPANATFTLCGAPMTPTFVNAAAGYFEFARTLTCADNGCLLVATYTDAQGAVRTTDALITIHCQQDTWAPIIVYPAQDIIVNLDPCGPSTAIVVFEATATDNCGVASFTATLPAGVTGAVILPSAGGSRIQVAAAPGTYIITLTATDLAGNVRQEDFRIIVTQAPRPVANLACNDNINVTLNANCQAVITPDMVLEGDPGCLLPADFILTVVDGNVGNGNIVDGCGTFNYNIAVAPPLTVSGFTGAFAPGNWTTVLPAAQFGGSVTFTGNSLTLVSPDGAACANQQVSAAIAMPAAGNVSFNWSYNNPDPGFELFIVQITPQGGVTTTLVNTGNTGAGVVNRAVATGDVLFFAARSVDCIFGAATATITNFAFQGLPNPNSGDFTQCWGTLTAEDKTAPALNCPDDTNVGSFVQEAQIVSGSLGAPDAQLDYSIYPCFLEFTAINGGGNRFYDTYTFTVTQTDIYTFDFNSTIPGGLVPGGNGMGALFAGAFDPTNPCENMIAQNDQVMGAGGGIFTPNLIAVATVSFSPTLRLVLPLEAGQTYTLFTTTTQVNVTGTYNWVIYSDGAGQLVNVPVTPAVETRALICEDLDQVTVNTLPANVPRCYKTDRLGNVILPTNAQQRQLLQQLLTRLEMTGLPRAGALNAGVTDNCGFIEICVTDVVVENATVCLPATVTRTFCAKDKQDGDYVAPNTSPCTGQPNSVCCTQVITIRKPNIADVRYPPFTQFVECDESFPVDANGNPHPDLTGFPFLRTAIGFHDLNQAYCNLSASYFDFPRAVLCESSYTFRRDWTIFDWCFPGNSRVWTQLIKVGDFTGPEITCPCVDNNWDGVCDLITYSTGPFNCTAAFAVPMPTITDNCSDWTLLTQIVTTIQAPVYNQWGQQIGTTPQDVIVATIPHGANRFVSNIPVGCHRFRYTATDDCGKISTIECLFHVEDLVEPIAVCDDQLNISIGGQGLARVYAEDIDEGSSDNCGPIRIEVRRTYTENPNTCAPISPTTGAEENGALPWGAYVDFTCCDVNDMVRIELRVWDDRNGDGIPGNTIPVVQCDGTTKQVTDNNNICWLDLLIEDKIRPFCVAPHNVTIDCDDVPYDFNPTDTTQLQELFGHAMGSDNCPGVSVRELTPSVNLHDCGFGFITRAFRVTDAVGNISTNSCTQTITINEVHNYEIKFPKDVSGICGPLLFDTTIVTNELGCDLLAVSVFDEPFEASDDECYKIFRTFRVLNWCEYDGTSPAKIVSRDEDCDGFNNALLVGDEDVWVLVRPNGSVYYDRDNNELNTNPSAFTKGTQCDGITNPTGHWINSTIDINATRDPITGAINNSVVPNLSPNDNIRDISSVGFWQYTQIIKVYDNIKPVVTFEPTDPFCSINAACTGPVEVPFSIDENCTPDDLTIKIFLDAFSDGILDGNVTASVLSGTYPDYLLSGVYPIGEHIFEVHVEDGCGNFTQVDIPFSVVDCKAPVPVCINGLAIELMPTEPNTDADGDGDIDAGAMAIWASDFLVSLPGEDCTGPIKYSIHKSDDVVAGTDIPSPDQTGIVLTCDDLGTVIVRIYAWDSAFNPYAVQPDGTVGGPNFDWCETYILVQDNMFNLCGGGGRVAGLIATEEQEPVAEVEVNLSGLMSGNVNTPINGSYDFSGLETGVQADYTVAPELDTEPLNGVSTFDLVMMSRHILSVEPLNSPYKLIAADVNNDKKITTIDLIHLRKLILAIDTDFANNTSWRFVRADYVFPVPTNPWFEEFPEVYNVNDLTGEINNADFVAVKIGDVNSSAATSFASIEQRNIEGLFALEVEDQQLTAGNEYTVTFKATEIAKIRGYQGTLTLNHAAVELVNVAYGAVKEESFGMRYAAEGLITTSWNGEATKDDVLFSLVLRAKTDASVSEVLGISSRYTTAEAYRQNGALLDLGIRFSSGVLASGAVVLEQNTPNPFAERTVIGFTLPASRSLSGAEAQEVTLTITDAQGRVVKLFRGNYGPGRHTQELEAKDLPAGVLFYTLRVGNFSATRGMIVQE